ncbi:hypothetical protein Dvina_00810 [Dactylosporangium vinaceum]|uniref:VOC family protein n=1 Tax=Dactylosporangium vinaceum TaxID=53362 RepID=A0ABV5MLY8_9ACTN|nr:hypothetical protein [Dactylosporangium vinaceum]UAB96811.1 hypothetical protein Dvina_00810 [Dactylosporangium vinaceum]
MTRDVPASAEFYGQIFGWTDQEGAAPGVTMEYHEWVSHNRVVGGLSVMDERYPAGTPHH